jgi:hypothetical protein
MSIKRSLQIKKKATTMLNSLKAIKTYDIICTIDTITKAALALPPILPNPRLVMLTREHTLPLVKEGTRSGNKVVTKHSEPVYVPICNPKENLEQRLKYDERAEKNIDDLKML